jgi:hypothetical protein
MRTGMVSAALVLGLLGCRHAAPPSLAIGNTSSSTARPLRKLTPEVFLAAHAQLEHAYALQEMGDYLQAYAAAQRGLNLLDGDPDLDNGALLEVSTSQASQDELVFMTETRTRELERRISGR